jgi:membrane associated rhomboid family serine protease
MAPRRYNPTLFTMPRVRPAVRLLLGLLLGLSISTAALTAWGPGWLADRVARWVFLFPGAVFQGRVVGLLTYPFLVLDPVNLIFAALWIWWLGSALESAWGMRRVLLHYFASSLLGGLFGAILAIAIPSIGARPVAGGLATGLPLLVGFALSAPDREVAFLLLPPFRARLLIPIALGFILLSTVMGGSAAAAVVPLGVLVSALLLAQLQLPSARRLLLRLRVLWIERKIRGRKLHLVPGLKTQDSSRGSSDGGSDGGSDDDPAPRSGGSGSDRYLH